MEIKEIEDKVKEQMSTPEGIKEMEMALVEHCYNSLNKRDKEIYEEALTIFNVDDCNGNVLPVLIMGYLELGITSKSAIIKNQSSLVKPFVETEAMHWVIDKLLSYVGKSDDKSNMFC